MADEVLPLHGLTSTCLSSFVFKYAYFLFVCFVFYITGRVSFSLLLTVTLLDLLFWLEGSFPSFSPQIFLPTLQISMKCQIPKKVISAYHRHVWTCILLQTFPCILFPCWNYCLNSKLHKDRNYLTLYTTLCLVQCVIQLWCFINIGWGKTRFTAVSMWNTEFILVLLFMNCCIIFPYEQL